MRRVTIAATVGAALAFFFDPQSGSRRRAVTRDRMVGTNRRQVRRIKRAAWGVRAGLRGRMLKLAHRWKRAKDVDDATLARKVETEIFRAPDAPKATVNVNAQEGVVQLRGEVESAERMRDLVGMTRRVQGVRAVENLLHLPGTPARMHQ